MKKKQTFTLLEIMIVIVLIGLISSAVGYTMKGSLDKGKQFKTDQAVIRLRDLLELEIANGANPVEVAADPEPFLRNSGLVKDPAVLLRDGWNNRFTIAYDVDSDELVIHSPKTLPHAR